MPVKKKGHFLSPFITRKTGIKGNFVQYDNVNILPLQHKMM